jgi:hypothetical protein
MTLFIDLGFLVPFSTLINITLKNIFAVARPPQFLHLVPYHIDYGFPSGDVQVGLIFWGMIFLKTNSTSFKIFASFIVAGISMSRIYLGVHSVYDVIGGLIFGSVILIIYNSNYCRSIINKWLSNFKKSYWYMFILVNLIYGATIIDKPVSNLALASIGVLLGFGIVLKYISSHTEGKANIFQILYSLTTLFIFYKFFPLCKSYEILFYLSVILKYAVLTLLIYILLPSLQRRASGIVDLS